MLTTISRRSFLFSCVATLAAGSVSRAADAESGVPLTDDYSRGEIFQQFVIDPWLVANASEAETLAIPSSFQFPRDVLYDCTVQANHRCLTDTSKPRTESVIFGVDVNHYTDRDDFSFSQLRDQEVRFVQMKSSQGDRYRDDNFPFFWQRAGQLSGNQKVFRGPYHFLAASADGKKQADWFLTLLSKAELQPDDMAPGVDLEWDVYTSTGKLDHWKDKGAQFIIDTALSCLERIHDQTGRIPVLYTGKSWFGPHTIPLERFTEFEKYPLWVFDYDPLRKIKEKPVLPDNKISAALWQFTSTARVTVSSSQGLDASVALEPRQNLRRSSEWLEEVSA